METAEKEVEPHSETAEKETEGEERKMEVDGQDEASRKVEDQKDRDPHAPKDQDSQEKDPDGSKSAASTSEKQGNKAAASSPSRAGTTATAVVSSASFVQTKQVSLSEYLQGDIRQCCSLGNEGSKKEIARRYQSLLGQPHCPTALHSPVVDAYFDVLPSSFPTGGFVLPPLQWNQSFRKGYSVLMWIRPVRSSATDGTMFGRAPPDAFDMGESDSPTNKTPFASPRPAGGGGGAGSGAARRTQLLYRFATSPENQAAIGVCATLSPWTVTTVDEVVESDGGVGEGKGETGDKSRNSISYLQSTVTVFTLPSMSPSSMSATPNAAAAAAVAAASPPPTAQGKRGGRLRRGNSNNKGGGNKDNKDNATQHDRNMAQFASGGPGCLSYVSATLTLAENEWTLVGITHSSPFLKKPRLDICIQGSELTRGELTYPVLPQQPQQQQSAPPQQSPSPGGLGDETTSHFHQVEADAPGVMGYCTLLDNFFGSGVESEVLVEDDVDVVDLFLKDGKASSRDSEEKEQPAAPTTDEGRQQGPTVTTPAARAITRRKVNLPYHLHVASISLYSEPVSPNIQALAAEYGPNHPPGMIIAPVPPVAQCRDALVYSVGRGMDTRHAASSSTSASSLSSSVTGGRGGIAASRHGTAAGGSFTPSGRGVGIPISVGGAVDAVSSSILGDVVGGLVGDDPLEVVAQRLMGKAVLGFSAVDAVALGGSVGAPQETPTKQPPSAAPSTPEPASANQVLSPLAEAAALRASSKTIGFRARSSVRSSSSSLAVDTTPPPPQQQQQQQQRIICPMSLAPLSMGATDVAPKIGIVQPRGPVASTVGSAAAAMAAAATAGDGTSPGRPLLRCTGAVRLFNATNAFVERVARRENDTGTIILLPSHGTSSDDSLPPPSLFLSYQSINPVHILLLPFRLALPPPAHGHKLQMNLYHESFLHLKALLRNDGEYAAHLISLIATSLTVSSALRDDALQTGALHSLSSLLRQVLIRGHKFGLCAKGRQMKPELMDNILGGEVDVLDECYDHVESCPCHVPCPIVESAVALVDACCGPVWPPVALRRANVAATPPAHLTVRRTSDLALTCLFGFALDMDLWGRDWDASNSMLQAVVDRYCVEMPAADGGEPLEQPLDYGWLLRLQMSVQFWLDTMRLYFSEDSFVEHHDEVTSDDDMNKEDGAAPPPSGPLQFSPSPMMALRKAISMSEPESEPEPDAGQPQQALTLSHSVVLSVANSLSSILYHMLKYSLTSTDSISRGEHDVMAAVAALSDAPLGGVAAHAILSALQKLLLFCEVVYDPNPAPSSATAASSSSKDGSTMRSRLQDQSNGRLAQLLSFGSTSASLPGSSGSSSAPGSDDALQRLRRLKTELASRLGRNMLIGQFHDVVAPLILSRTVFSGRRLLLKTEASSKERVEEPEGAKQEGNTSTIDWRHHWRVSLLLFAWLTSIAGPDGEQAAKSAGSLLLVSGKAASLYGCLVFDDAVSGNGYIVSLVLPAVPPRGLHQNDDARHKYLGMLQRRIRVITELLPGLVSSLTSQQQQPSTEAGETTSSKPADVSAVDPVSARAVEMVTELVSTVAVAFRRLYGLGAGGYLPNQWRNDTFGPKLAVKAAKEALPSLLTVAALLDDAIALFCGGATWSDAAGSAAQSPKEKTDSSSTKTSKSGDEPGWVNVGSSDSVPNDSDAAILAGIEPSTKQAEGEGLWAKLSTSKDEIIQTTAALVVNAMILGGGEASTVVWRVVLATLTSCCRLDETTVDINSSSMKDEEGEPKLTDDPTGTDTSDDMAIKASASRDEEVGLLSSSTKSGRQSRRLLSHLASIVFSMISGRRHQESSASSGASQAHDQSRWTNVALCSATARLCDLVEEKELLRKPFGVPDSEESSSSSYCVEQFRLLSEILYIMESGRNCLGWCQLVISELASSSAGGGEMSPEALATASVYHQLTDWQFDTFQGTTRLPRSSIETSSSKLLLPILQPSLRVVLGCMCLIRSDDVVPTSLAQPMLPKKTSASPLDETQRSRGSSRKNEILSQVMSELEKTLTAAIVGLAFANARDVCLGALSALRQSMQDHRIADDSAALDLCGSLTVKVVEEMRHRYNAERRRRDEAEIAYDEEKESQGGGGTAGGTQVRRSSSSEMEAARSVAVERLIVGEDVIPRSAGAEESAADGDAPSAATDQNKEDGQEKQATGGTQENAQTTSRHEGEDFLMYRDAVVGNQPGQIARSESVNEPGGPGTVLGWNDYKGFGAALDKCSPDEGKGDESADAQTSTPVDPKRAEETLSILAPYLDMWDARQARDAAESELVELFDSVNLGSSMRTSSSSVPSQITVLPGSETAADAMTAFIELASAETGRMGEVKSSYFPSRRFGYVTFSDRQCWRVWMELFDNVGGIWERCMADGARGYGRRLATSPISPQFQRFIPSYLDHSNSVTMTQSQTATMAEAIRETLLEGDEAGPKSELEDMQLTTKNLVAAGNVEIVDITKKEAEEEVADDPMAEGDEGEKEEGGDDVDVDEVSLGFPDEDKDVNVASEGDTGTISSTKSTAAATTVTASASSGTEQQRSEKQMPYTPNKYQQQQNSHQVFVASCFSVPPDGGASRMGFHGSVEMFFHSCLHVRAEGSRRGTLLLTPSHLIIEYDEKTGGLYEGEILALDDTRKRVIDNPDDKNVIEDPEYEAYRQEERRNLEDLERRLRTAAALRPKGMRWTISEMSHVYLRRYRLRDSALEMFFIPSGGSATGGSGLSSAVTSLFVDFGSGDEGQQRRDAAAHAIMKRSPPQTVKQWPEKSAIFLHDQLRALTMAWVKGRMTNFDYLLSLNCLAGRSYNDTCQYPVMPWVLSDYTSEEVPDLTDRKNFRDLSKPMGAINPHRLAEFLERFEAFQGDGGIPPFMYGSHYSTSAGVVLHFLVRLHPFASLHRQLQGGHFDVADRLFSSVRRTWDMCTGVSAAEVKELTPEWYCNPAFLRNANNFKLGTAQDGEKVDDVVLPPWADKSPEKFVEVMRCALESDICSEMLPDWIDLIFGRKQQGPEAVKANNVFFYLTYYGSVDVASIKDEALRAATELQIAHFGQCPMQLFFRPHVHKLPRGSYRRRLALTETLGLFEYVDNKKKEGDEKRQQMQPFKLSPLSYWVHLGAPPPGPHAPLVAVRLAGVDRCLAVDAQGIFHSFRWSWKAESEPSTSENGIIDPSVLAAAEEREANSGKQLPKDGNGSDGNDNTNNVDGAAKDGESEEDTESPDADANSSQPQLPAFRVEDLFADKGCFVADRELPPFRAIPRLPYARPFGTVTGDPSFGASAAGQAVVAISKTLFAARTLLLVLSDGDGRGALGMQLVDPAKGVVKSEVVVSGAHSAALTAIAMDAIGTASGTGGVGGELVVVGSSDGTASVWRFISSHYFPLRPRLRATGHSGSPIHAVAICSPLNVFATMSRTRLCLYCAASGSFIRSISPPQEYADDGGVGGADSSQPKVETIFADTPALCLSVQGFLVTVCKTDFFAGSPLITLHMFTLEGIHVGSRVMERWRGVPRKMCASADGRAVMVCAGRGVTFHRVSASDPLEIVDEWHITEMDCASTSDVPTACDVDFGPSLARPVVAAAGCTDGVLRLHALRGISEWTEENRRTTVTAVVGNALARPARQLQKAVGRVGGIGSRFVGFGKEIGREAVSDVKERGVGGFLGGMLYRK